MIPHFSVLANVIQMAHYTGAKDESRPVEMQRYRPGSRCLGRKSFIYQLRRGGRFSQRPASRYYSSAILP